ncbi:MAG: hypothetical protein SGI86_11315 [Deltaproteobacteria bacterium]|nr:hypothetical protein [Deltaproteobacteria bacterium]
MMFNKAFRVCVLAFSLPMGLMACDNEGTAGGGPTLSASSGGAEPGSLSSETGVGGGLSAAATQSPNYGESPVPSPGSLSADSDVPSGSSGGGGGGSCNAASACDEYKKALASFVRRACAKAGAGVSQCQASLEAIYGEFDASCREAINSGEATPAQVCEAVGCVSCFFDNASLTSSDQDPCSVTACRSECTQTCRDQPADGDTEF